MIFFLLIILTLGYQFFYRTALFPKEIIQIDQNSSDPLLILSSPLHIIGNTSLSFVASSGNGTKNNPYIIENLTINGMGIEECIKIEDTTAYSIVRNCFTFNGTYGIHLKNVVNSILHNNTVKLNKEGIILFDSRDNIISENIVTLNNVTGISLLNSNNNTFLKNNASYNFLTGIFCISSTKNKFLENIMVNNSWYGLRLFNSNNTEIIRNNMSYNEIGISLGNSNNNTLLDNFIINNTVGIYVDGSNKNIIQNNHINANKIKGIYLYNSNYNTIIYNKFIHNGQAIVEEPNCVGNIIKDNTIIDGNGDGIPGFSYLFVLIAVSSLIFLLKYWKEKINVQISVYVSKSEQT